jgi:hypothetical protein
MESTIEQVLGMEVEGMEYIGPRSREFIPSESAEVKIAGRKVFFVQGKGTELGYASEDLLQITKVQADCMNAILNIYYTSHEHRRNARQKAD